MIRLYHTNDLTITEITEYSVYADGQDYGIIPVRDTQDDLQVGDVISAYVYLDSADDVVATVATAAAQIGECAYLTVVSNSNSGTFLDWGLPKDLMLPFSEQLGNVREGAKCFVYIFQDERQRPTASMKLHRYLDEENDDLQVGDAVDLMIAAESDLGFKAVINNEYLGLIYHGELARPLEIGAHMKGWVKTVREDGKINLSISRLDAETRNQLENDILEQLQNNDGRLELSDKSSPDLIYSTFGVSKKNFKRAIGSLYKQRLITIAPTFIDLISDSQTHNEDTSC